MLVLTPMTSPPVGKRKLSPIPIRPTDARTSVFTMSDTIGSAVPYLFETAIFTHQVGNYAMAFLDCAVFLGRFFGGAATVSSKLVSISAMPLFISAAILANSALDIGVL